MPNGNPSTLRLFLALWPPQEVREALQAQSGQWTWPTSARRTRPERLHVTLHFLGPVPAARVPALRDALDVDWPGCELVLDAPRIWPGGIAVLEAAQVPEQLAALHATLASRLRDLELPVEERRYRPHVTFARKAFAARAPADTQPLRWRAGPRYLLVQSLPGGGGYEPVASFG